MTLLTVEEAESDVVAPSDVQRLLDATAIVEVRVDEVHAGPLRQMAESMEVQVDIEEPQFGRNDEQERVLVRFTHTVRMHPREAPDEVTVIQLSHIVVLDVTTAISTTWPAVAAWIETNVYFIAYPYVRQSVSAITASMGIPALTLSYLSRDDRPFAKEASPE